MKNIIHEIRELIVSIDFQQIWSHIASLITADNIALLSVIITILIYVASQRATLKSKKHEEKKIQYAKLVKLLQELYSGKKDKKGNLIISDETKDLFFDAGASLLLHGSKNIYKKYILFREFSTNPLIKQCKYYENDIIIYIIAEIFRRMRKEVGLNFFYNIDKNEAVAFFINDISSNPIAKEKSLVAGFRIRMIKFELFIIDRTRFIWIKTFYNTFIRTINGVLAIVIKHIVMIPLGRLITKLFPRFAKKISNKENDKAE